METTDDAPRSPRYASRLACIIAFALVTLLTSIAITGTQSVLVISIWLTDGLWLVPWLMTAHAIGGLALRRHFGLAADDATLRHVTATAIGLGAISLLILLLGSLPVGLRPPQQPAAIAVLAAGSVLALTRLLARGAAIAAWLAAPAGATWLALPGAVAVGVMGVAACVLPGVLWGADDPAGYDVLAYHLQLPREWFDLGRVATLPHNVFSFFPLGVEMHYLLAMQLHGGGTAGMYLSQLMHAGFVVLTMAAVYGAARSRGRVAAGVATLVVAGVPWTFMLGGVAYNEGGLMLYATLAAAWAMRGRWALAGTCAGLAAGCKLTGVSSAIVLVPLILAFGATGIPADVGPKAEAFATRTSAGMPAPPFRAIFLFLAFALLTFSPWLLRTAIASGGNPVFPVGTKLFGHGPFDAGQAERFDVAHAPRPDQQSIAGRLGAFKRQVMFDYHFGTGWIANGPVMPWLFLLFLPIAIGRRDQEMYRWLALILGNVLVWLFFTHLQGRFLVQVIPLWGLIVSCCFERVRLASEDPARIVPAADEQGRYVLGYGRMPAGGTWTRDGAVLVSLVVLATAFLSWPTPLATLQKSVPALGVPGEPTQLRQFLPDDVARAIYDTDQPIVLVGDAKAFWYAIPSARLHYRGVFDVRTGTSFRDAWLGDVPANALVVVDPNELNRFARTYRNLPPIPEAWRGRGEAFVVRADQLP